MKVFVQFNYWGYIVAIFLDEKKAVDHLSDGDYIEKWDVV